MSISRRWFLRAAPVAPLALAAAVKGEPSPPKQELTWQHHKDCTHQDEIRVAESIIDALRAQVNAAHRALMTAHAFIERPRPLSPRDRQVLINEREACRLSDTVRHFRFSSFIKRGDTAVARRTKGGP